MKSSSLIACIALALSNAAIAQQSTAVQGSAAGESKASVAADRNGASASHSAAGSVDAATEHGSVGLDQGAELNATLSKPVDARTAKPGDEVVATANEDLKSNGQVMVKKGSKLVGRVTAARPLGRAEGSASGAADSQLGIVFDRAVLKDGREVPLNASIQAIAAAQSGASAGMNDVGAGVGGAGSAAGSARSGGGGLVGGVAGGAAGAVGGLGSGAGGVVHSGVSGTTGVLGKSAGAAGGLNAAGQLTSGSKGVFGMKGIDIASTAAGSAQGSVLSSSARNVRLDRGTRMLLVSGSGAGAGAINGAGAKSGGATSADSSATLAREPK